MPTKTLPRKETARELIDRVNDSYREITGVRLEIPESAYGSLLTKMAGEEGARILSELRESRICMLGYAALDVMNVAAQTRINGKAPYLEVSKKMDTLLQKWIKTGDERVDQAGALMFSLAFRMSLNILLIAHAETKERTGETKPEDIAESVDYWLKCVTRKAEKDGLFDFLPSRMADDHTAIFDELVKSKFAGTEFMRLKDEVIIATILLFVEYLQKSSARPSPRLKLSLVSFWATKIASSLARSEINLQTVFTDTPQIIENMPDVMDAEVGPPLGIFVVPTIYN